MLMIRLRRATRALLDKNRGVPKHSPISRTKLLLLVGWCAAAGWGVPYASDWSAGCRPAAGWGRVAHAAHSAADTGRTRAAHTARGAADTGPTRAPCTSTAHTGVVGVP